MQVSKEISKMDLNDPERTFASRTSRRAFTDRKVPEDLVGIIKGEESVKGFFGEWLKFDVVDEDSGDVHKGNWYNWHQAVSLEAALKSCLKKLILKKHDVRKKPHQYLVGAVTGGMNRQESTRIDPGYVLRYSDVGLAAEFHKRLLKATELGISSYMMGVFNQDHYLPILGLTQDWRVGLLAPLGFSPDTITKAEETIRKLHNHGEYKPLSELFIDKGGKPAYAQATVKYALDQVTKSPNSGGQQSWTFVKGDGNLHLFMELSSTKRGLYLRKHLKEMDAGIAMATFGFWADKLKMDGDWFVDHPGFRPSEDHVYISTFKFG